MSWSVEPAAWPGLAFASGVAFFLVTLLPSVRVKPKNGESESNDELVVPTWAQVGRPTSLTLGVVSLWAWLGFFVPRQLESSVAGAGPLGDQFGAVTSLFTGLAFAGLIWTIWQQREEIKLQKRQLDELITEQEESR